MPNTLIGADFSQIEARVLCWLFGQLDMLIKFRTKADIYSDFGNEWLYRGIDPPISKDNPLTRFERSVCKECILGCGFGLGGAGFHRTLMRRGLTSDILFAEKAVATYRQSVPQVVQGWLALDNAIHNALQEKGLPMTLWHGLTITPGFVHLPSGRVLRYGTLMGAYDRIVGRNGAPYEKYTWRWHKQGRQWEKLYGQKLTENVVQAIARDVMVMAILFFRRHYQWKVPWMVPKLSVHDELIWCVPETKVGMASELIAEGMLRTIPWAPDLPIDCEIHAGRSYYDLK
jgi:hypothetical protein